ncbi:WOX9 [Psidium guajava]|nr:WOX9 [Psidium guajava]
MASSNKHWPSMFKSKPCNTQHHQWQHDLNPSLLSSSGCHRTSPYSSANPGAKAEVEPEAGANPHTRGNLRLWDGQPAEGRNSENQDSIAGVWASRRRQCVLLVPEPEIKEQAQAPSPPDIETTEATTKPKHHNNHNLNPMTSSMSPTITAPNSSSSSSSSERTSPTGHQGVSACGFTQAGQGFCFSPLTSVVQVPYEQCPNIGPCTSLLLSEIMNNNNNNAAASEKLGPSDHHKVKMMQLPTSSLGNNYSVVNHPGTTQSAVPTTVTTSFPLPSTNIQNVQGAPEAGDEAKSTVFINGVAFQVAPGHST